MDSPVTSTRSGNRRVLHAMTLVAVITVVGKLALTGRDLFVADRFGTSDALDAYLLALMIPLYVVGLLAASFTSAFVPTFIRVRERQGADAASRLFASAQVGSMAVLVAVSIVLALVLPVTRALLATQLSTDKADLTGRLFLILLPVIPLSGVATMWAAVMNAGERFAIPAAAPVVTPLVPIAFLALTVRPSVEGLAVTTVVGYACEAVVLGVALWWKGWLVRPRWGGWTDDLRHVGRQYVPVVAGSVMLGTAPLIDQSMAATIASGSVSALNYASKVTSFALGVGAVAVSTAILPHFSQLVATERWTEIRRTLRIYGALIVAVSVPLAIIGALASRPVVVLLFEHGQFNASDTSTVARAQAMFVLQLPFYLVGILVVRLISSLHANRFLLWGAVLSTVCNIVLNLVLMNVMGVAGIALSTTIVYALSCTYLGAVVLRLLAESEAAT